MHILYDSIYMNCLVKSKYREPESRFIALDQGWKWGVTAHGHRFSFGVMKMFWNWRVVMVYAMYTFIGNHKKTSCH